MQKWEKKKLLICLMVVIGLLVYCCSLQAVRMRNRENYKQAEQYFKDGNSQKAVEIYRELGAYKDAKEKADKIAIYIEAEELLENGEYDEAIKKWESLSGFGNSTEKIKQANYELAIKYMEKNDYDRAKEYFSKADGYEKSELYYFGS